MDCSWLLEDVAEDSPDPGSDSEENTTELEDRLYAIVHHNDLSQPLAPELAKHFSVHSDNNGEVVVTLKNSLEDIKSEECRTANHLLTNPDDSKNESTPLNNNNKEDDDDVVIISEVTTVQKPTDCINPKVHQNDSKTLHAEKSSKRFRYSNLTLDKSGELQFGDIVNEPADSTTYDIDFFKIPNNFFQNPKHYLYRNIRIPNLHNSSDWKIDSNASFISIGKSESPQDRPEIIEKMTDALKEINPNITKKKLRVFANLLFSRNMKIIRRRAKVKRKKAQKNGLINGLNPEQYIQSQHHFINNQRNTSTPKTSKNMLNGSITLNISPFKPSEVIDLDSSVEENSKFCSTDTPLRISKGSGSKAYLPTKWTKSMIKFYTVPSKKKMEFDAKALIEKMKKTTKASDWYVVPQDRSGHYKRKRQDIKYTHARCANCRERGHLSNQCPKPKKITTCSLCGLPYHTDYSCPNRVCMKCGVYLPGTNYNGECDVCYYHSFESYDVPCEVCGRKSHRTALCTDLWRSFHATTSGEKKIPAKGKYQVKSNPRKYCCNCAQEGHFAHTCPFQLYSEQHVSSFVSNYSGIFSGKGTTEIYVPEHYEDIVNGEEADRFLQNLSNSTNAYIEVDRADRSFVFRISGTFGQCKRVQSEIETFVNTNKRKREEPPMPKRKRRKMKH